MQTAAPSRASLRAIDRPNPRDAPVIKAVCPLKLMGLDLHETTASGVLKRTLPGGFETSLRSQVRLGLHGFVAHPLRDGVFQLLDAYRLAEIVVHARGQAALAVSRQGIGGEPDDGRVAVSSFAE